MNFAECSFYNKILLIKYKIAQSIKIAIYKVASVNIGANIGAYLTGANISHLYEKYLHPLKRLYIIPLKLTNFNAF